MEYIIGYLSLGVLISMALSEIDKWQVAGEEMDTITNLDRIIHIFLWPVMLVVFIYCLRKYNP